MKLFEIKINEILPPEEGKQYNRSETIFAQTVEDLDLAAVIAVVNNLTKKRKRTLTKKPKVISNEEFERLKGK